MSCPACIQPLLKLSRETIECCQKTEYALVRQGWGILSCREDQGEGLFAAWRLSQVTGKPDITFPLMPVGRQHSRDPDFILNR